MQLEQVAEWCMNARARVRTRAGLAAHALVALAALGYAGGRVAKVVAPVAGAPRPAALPPDHGDVRFGLPLETRKAIFRELAAAEPQSIQNGKTSFPGKELEWSAEDHRGAFERQTVASLMPKYGATMTQAYLCLDEGIRAHWPGPDGKPLNPHTVPLHPRRKYGW